MTPEQIKTQRILRTVARGLITEREALHELGKLYDVQYPLNP